MKTKLIKTESAVGMILSHDITRIEKGVFKGVAFKKGHIIKNEDVPVLLSLGKNNVYSIALDQGDVHEEEAGLRLAEALAGENLDLKGPSEGRVDLIAKRRGLLKVNKEVIHKINLLDDIVVSTLHDNVVVEGGTTVCGTKVIPLVIGERFVQEAEKICKDLGPALKVKPFQQHRMAVVITGREVFEGKVEDAFAPVLTEKAEYFGVPRPLIDYVPDDAEAIAEAINKAVLQGASIVVVTGGMSVDPDDVTPTGIKKSGASMEKYGAPVLPGAMFLVAYREEVPILGLPACGMFFDTTVFDLILPRVLAGERVTAEEISFLGYGGLCRRCETCRFPSCSFGKR